MANLIKIILSCYESYWQEKGPYNVSSRAFIMKIWLDVNQTKPSIFSLLALLVPQEFSTFWKGNEILVSNVYTAVLHASKQKCWKKYSTVLWFWNRVHCCRGRSFSTFNALLITSVFAAGNVTQLFLLPTTQNSI